MKKILGIMLAVCMVATLSISALAASEVEDSAANVSAAQLMEDQQSVQRRGPYKGMVTQNGVNVRSGPGTSYASYGYMNKGDTVWIYNYNNYPWVYVLCDSPHKGQFGYIHANYVTEVPD